MDGAARPNKRNIIILVIFTILLVFLTLPAIFYKYAVENSSNITKDTQFEIKSGTNVSEIAKNLEVKGLITSSKLFRLYLKLNKLDTGIQAGIYYIPAKSSIRELAEILQHGRNDVSLRYIEGWRIEQLAEEASDKLESVDYSEFVQAAKEYEGQLFPDTYFLNKDTGQEDLLNLLKTTFNQKT